MRTRPVALLASGLLVALIAVRAHGDACHDECDRNVAKYGSKYWVEQQCYPRCGAPPPAAGGGSSGGKATSSPSASATTVTVTDPKAQAADIARWKASNRQNYACQAKCDAIPITTFGSEYWRKTQCKDPCDKQFPAYNIVYNVPKKVVPAGPSPADQAALAALKAQFDGWLPKVRA